MFHVTDDAVLVLKAAKKLRGHRLMRESVFVQVVTGIQASHLRGSGLLLARTPIRVMRNSNKTAFAFSLRTH
jgi:hypothetical protein